MRTVGSMRAFIVMSRLVVLVALALVASVGIGRSKDAPPTSDTAAIASQAYVYGYPLVTMEMTRRVATNAVVPEENGRAPEGQFSHMRKYPDATFKDVTAPNADTLYSSAWLDLSQEPYVLSIPDMKGRFFLMQMLDGWTNVFASPGKRTTGTKAQKYAIVGPNFRGELPKDVKELRSPTNMVWIIGRTYSTGTADDFKAVHELQDKMALVPLSSYGKPYTAPYGAIDPKVDMVTPVRDQVDRLEGDAFFMTLATAMKNNPSPAADQPMLDKMRNIGIVSGESFDPKRLDSAQSKAIAATPKAAQSQMVTKAKSEFTTENGWEYSTKLGKYGTNYDLRALTAVVGLGANLPKDAVYPVTFADADGKPYSGANKYVMHFPKGKEPPVEAFWSITMYDSSFFFVPNALHKYAVSPRDKLKKNADGSTDIYIQSESPGADKESNWLPAPPDKFVLMLRMYWPKEKPPSILDGSWKPEAVRLVTPGVGGGPTEEAPAK